MHSRNLFENPTKHEANASTHRIIRKARKIALRTKDRDLLRQHWISQHWFMFLYVIDSVPYRSPSQYVVRRIILHNIFIIFMYVLYFFNSAVSHQVHKCSVYVVRTFGPMKSENIFSIDS